jgi:hypothetical protein
MPTPANARPLLLAFCATLALLLAGGASASRGAFDPALSLDGSRLALRGSGTAYYARIFRVYDAALYAPAGVPLSEVAAGHAPRCLLLEYRREVTRDLIVTAAVTVLTRQGVSLPALQERLDRLHAAYRDVGEGDRYALCHAPGRATRLLLNGQELIRVDGDDFAAAYFGIWLRGGAISEELRATLLGDAATPAS